MATAQPPGRAPLPVGYLLNVCKEPGPTSHDVVARVRRIAGERRVGHAGTLDPAAAGVLVVCVGTATRLSEYYAGHDKVYAAEIVFGVATDTYDADGTITATSDDLPTEPALRRELDALLGEQWQQPPPFAAIKQEGQPLYRRARAGEAVSAPPRRVVVRALVLERWAAPAAHVLIHCSSGTYVRALAHDLGRRLGCAAYVHRLVRVVSGPCTLATARTLDQWAAAFADGSWPELVDAPDLALLDWPALLLEEADERALGHGMPVAGREPRPGEPAQARAYGQSGELAGLVRWDEGRGQWWPTKVLR